MLIRAFFLNSPLCAGGQIVPHPIASFLPGSGAQAGASRSLSPLLSPSVQADSGSVPCGPKGLLCGGCGG